MALLLDSGFTEEEIQRFVEILLSKYGKVTHRSGGMCGSVFFFDQGENAHPRYIAVKVPRAPSDNPAERHRRFLREIQIQHNTFSHEFVCHPFDYEIVFDTPVALYRATSGDLSKWIPQAGFSNAGRLSTLSYLCAALIHCRQRGVLNHQDLKPQNVLMRDYRSDFDGLPVEDVYTVPLLADFGLANMSLEHDRADGPKPYMSPEQWSENKANGASDVFSFGVIMYEVMTRGIHPIGERVSDWWPTPREGNSKKWLRDDHWKRWAKAGNAIAPNPQVSGDFERLVRDCMSPKPELRPSFEEVQGRLLRLLRSLDSRAYDQAAFRINYANSNAGTVDDWPYRNHRLERLLKLLEIDEAGIVG
jgi:serine/threonine protein kinase